jgi:molecular chaperone GrpE
MSEINAEEKPSLEGEECRVEEEPLLEKESKEEQPEDAPESVEQEMEVESLEEACEAARLEAAENFDRFLRARAELDNYRKRTAKIRQETREDTLRELLMKVAPILDNMRRALGQESENVQSLKQGVELIYSQLGDALKGYGLEPIEAVGQPFDPHLHEALMEVVHDEYSPGTVIEELDKGYKLNDKVVRPARVVVCKAAGENG